MWILTRMTPRGPEAPLFLHVLCKEFLCALPGEVAGLFAVARALVAIKAMRRIRIGVDLGLRLFLLDVSTTSIGMPSSFSPKCICIGHFGFSSANSPIMPP